MLCRVSLSLGSPGVEILTAEQMRHVDRRTVREFGVPEIVLMENAGLRLFGFLQDTYPDLRSRRLLLLCGRGNNGGDVFVLARHLHNQGIPFQAVLFGPPGGAKGSAGVNLGALRRLGIKVLSVVGPAGWRRARRLLEQSDLVVDGILGTGLSRPVTGLLARVFQAINRSGVEVVAVDIPSGLSGDSDGLPGPSIRASHTVTFARPKIPHVLPPARERCGTVHVADISIPREAVAAEPGTLELLDAAPLAAALPRRRADSHKGDFGHVLVVAGSRGKAGAARMTSLAALRAGCGLVTTALPAILRGRLVASAMEVMTEEMPETSSGALAYGALPRLLRLLEGKRALAIGPGLTTDPETRRLVRALVSRSRIPVVLDADGLNAFARETGLPTGARRPLLLTPHPGEMARLLGVTTREVQRDRVRTASRLASRLRCHVILKGHLTVIARPDGSASINPTGNPGMATGGSGDVLTGLLAGLLAQGLEAATAARLGVYLHGLAGDLAAAETGESPLLARDILSHFPRALSQIRRTAAESEPLEACP